VDSCVEQYECVCYAVNFDIMTLMHGIVKNGLRDACLVPLWWIAIFSMPMVRLGTALDSHWSSGWLIFSLLLIAGFLLRIVSLSGHVVWMLLAWTAITLIQMSNGHTFCNEDALLAIYFIFIISCRPVYALSEVRSVKTWVTVLWSVFSIFLISLLVKNALLTGYSHGTTYEVKPLFAHRNIAIESYSLLSAGAIALMRTSRWRWLLMSVVFVVITAYQVRTAFLGFGLFVVMEIGLQCYQRRWFKWLVGCGILAVLASQVFFAVLRQPEHKPKFDALPDIVKNFDVVYNLNRAESSSERLVMWRWTTDHTTWMGEGCGNWKFMAEGYVNAELGKCDLVVRHPHADVLKMCYEMGIIGCALFIGWLIFFVRPAWRYWIVFAPMFLFAFPTERAETLSALLVLLLCSSEASTRRSVTPVASLLMMALLIFTTAMWHHSQNFFGKAMRDPLLLKYATPLDRTAMDAFPFDIVLNRLPTYQAIVLADAGKTEEAKSLLLEVLAQHPNDQGAIRLLQRLGAELPPSAHVCENDSVR
jgi:O-antigen ligase